MYEVTLDAQDPGRVSQLLSINCPPPAAAGAAAGPSLDFLPKSLAYTAAGRLILTDEKGGRIYAADQNGGHRLTELAGSFAFCKRQENGCLRSDFSDSLTVGSRAHFGSISDLTVGPEGVLYLTDQDRHQVKAVLVGGHLPQVEDRYEVIDPAAQALHVFDRQGRHVATKGLFAALTGFTFLYDAGAGNGSSSSTAPRLIQVGLYQRR